MIRLGILTYYASINYGAFLQAYALQKCLEDRYKSIADIEIINYSSKLAQDVYLDRIINQGTVFRRKMLEQYHLFLQSRKELNIAEEGLITDDISQLEHFLQKKYHIIVAGSDEIWKIDSMRGFPNGYWLNFDLEETVYMAYAVSGRNDYQNMLHNMQAYIRTAMNRFAYIGTRDEVTRQELLKIEERNIDRNCDPVFLRPQLFFVSDEEKKGVRKKYGLNFKKPLISIMIKNREVGASLHRMLKNDNQVICLYDINESVGEHNLTELSPFEWSKVISTSDLVFTDYFHCTAFSIIHKVPFIAIEGNQKGRGKIENLLIENGMEDKFLYWVDYHGESRKLAIDLYTKGRKEMINFDPFRSDEIMVKECQKADGFFEVLDNQIKKLSGINLSV